MPKQYLSQILRALTILSIMIGTYYLATYLTPYIYPLFIAIILANLIIPFINFLEDKFHFPRTLATTTVIGSLFLTLMGLVVVLTVEIYQGTMFLAEKIPSYFKEFVHYVESFFNNQIIPIQEKILSFFLTLDPSQQKSIKATLNDVMDQIANTGSMLLQETLGRIPNILSFLPNSFAVFIFIVIGTFLIANDWHRLKGFVLKSIPENLNTPSKQVFSHLKKALGGFIKAQFILISLSGLIILFGLIILQVEHALTIAALSALVDLIPFVGTGLIFIPWIIYLFFSGNYSLTIGLTILYMFVILTRQILEPKILSSNMGLHPLTALIGYFVGLQLWGLFGLLLAPAILILINAFYQTGVFRWMWQFIKGS